MKIIERISKTDAKKLFHAGESFAVSQTKPDGKVGHRHLSNDRNWYEAVHSEGFTDWQDFLDSSGGLNRPLYFYRTVEYLPAEDLGVDVTQSASHYQITESTDGTVYLHLRNNGWDHELHVMPSRGEPMVIIGAPYTLGEALDLYAAHFYVRSYLEGEHRFLKVNDREIQGALLHRDDPVKHIHLAMLKLAREMDEHFEKKEKAAADVKQVIETAADELAEVAGELREGALQTATHDAIQKVLEHGEGWVSTEHGDTFHERAWSYVVDAYERDQASPEGADKIGEIGKALAEAV
jgi:hypothetical protein